MKKPPLKTMFTIADTIKPLLDIPVIDLVDGQEEIWKFVNLDRHKEFNKVRKYLISTYGRVYNLETRSMVAQSKSYKSSKGEYRSVKLFYNFKGYTYLVHRLVALAFIPIDPNRPFVNHKDGIPFHNYVWNLEWCTNSENTIHAIQSGLKTEPRGENRSNAIWKDDEVRLICTMMEEGHKSTYIYKMLSDMIHDSKITYERVRTLYKHIIHRTHWTHISKDYDIDFTKKNYLKEKSSVMKKEMSNSEH